MTDAPYPLTEEQRAALRDPEVMEEVMIQFRRHFANAARDGFVDEIATWLETAPGYAGWLLRTILDSEIGFRKRLL